MITSMNTPIIPPKAIHLPEIQGALQRNIAEGCSILFLSRFYCTRNSVRRSRRFSRQMRSKSISCFFSAMLVMLWAAGLFAQNAAPAKGSEPQYSTQGTIASAAASPQGAVSYASMTELNGLLAQLENTSKTAQVDLTRMRIEKWKTDGSTKKQSLTDVDSIQRNLQDALPAMIGQLRGAPEDLPATFKLYRNLDALYDVMSGVVESAGAFGPRDDFQSLSNDLSGFESARKQLAERLETLAGSKEQEITRLRAELKTAQAVIPAAPPSKKIVVDDTQPDKKPPVKKKPAPKKPASTTQPSTPPTAAKPPSSQSQPQQQQ
jgi:hypothetical protein